MAGGIVAALLLAAAAAGVVALDRMSLALLRPVRRPVVRTPDALGLPWRETSIPSSPELVAWELDGERPDGPVVILAHGWGANQGTVLPMAAALLEAASLVFTYDVRGHGLSDRAPFVSLRQFRDDALRMIEHVRETLLERRQEGLSEGPARPTPSRVPILLVGHSMGGAAAVLAAESAALDAIALVATPCDVYGTMVRYLRERGIPGHLLVPLLKPFINRRIGVSPSTLDPARAIHGLATRVLIVQPELDTRVPPSEGRRLQELSGGRLEIIEDAGHSDVVTARRTGEVLRAFARSLVREERGA
jgi:pimeloyl-ACP methyl ester carboxylesterase